MKKKVIPHGLLLLGLIIVLLSPKHALGDDAACNEYCQEKYNLEGECKSKGPFCLGNCPGGTIYPKPPTDKCGFCSICCCDCGGILPDFEPSIYNGSIVLNYQGTICIRNGVPNSEIGLWDLTGSLVRKVNLDKCGCGTLSLSGLAVGAYILTTSCRERVWVYNTPSSNYSTCLSGCVSCSATTAGCTDSKGTHNNYCYNSSTQVLYTCQGNCCTKNQILCTPSQECIDNACRVATTTSTTTTWLTTTTRTTTTVISTTTTVTTTTVIGTTTTVTTTTVISPPPSTTTTTIPDNLCSPEGSTRCEGLALYRCEFDDSYGALNWVLVSDSSEECCSDGDCSADTCTSSRGVWLPGVSSFDPAETGYCCGDDGTADLGTIIDNQLCTLEDNNFVWVTGEECKRYANNQIIYTKGSFYVCSAENPGYYEGLYAKEYCENICNYYCDPQLNAWLDNRNPGIDILDEPLNATEVIDTRKNDLAGGFGCCPTMWCWNSEKCIENQADEPDNFYVYTLDSDYRYRCINGNWKPAKMVYTWDYTQKGYCPQIDEQCLVSYNSYKNNNNPNAYFTPEEPQCITTEQWILDYFCLRGNWISRASLVAFKLIQLASDNFELYCDDYNSALNYINYTVDGRAVIDYFRDCSRGNKQFNCVNNFCVLHDLSNDKVLLGMALNTNLFDPDKGVAPLLNVAHCEGESETPWDYLQCSENVIYNNLIETVIYSTTGVSNTAPISNWELFLQLIATPFETIQELVHTGQLQYDELAGAAAKFDIIQQFPLFAKLYIANTPLGSVQTVLEKNKLDLSDNKTKFYMMAKYEVNFDLCSQLNNFTSQYGRKNCDVYENEQVVVDVRESPSYLMSKWQDLTSKLFPYQLQLT